jgi:hypothetical protein
VPDGWEPGTRLCGGPDREGLRWSFDVDLDAVLAAIGRPQPDWQDIDQEEYLAAELEARDREDAPPPMALEGVIAETLPTGPALAAWLSGQDSATARSRDLIGMAAAFRRVASWAQAGELALVAQVAARSAADDARVGLAENGRPEQLTEDATAQVSLGLTLSHGGAEAWTGLAVTLRWRLPATAAALADGQIDLYRARIIAEATAPLSDAAAGRVEDRVLPAAGDLTYTQLHAAVRRAVIAADPEGAEHRRQAAERRAKVSLYPDQDCTATLTGTRLPAGHAAAAMARISAMAQALKASGAGGGIHLLRAHVFIGLLLGTLPLIPPPAGGPPDTDPPPDDDCERGPHDSRPPGDESGPGDDPGSATGRPEGGPGSSGHRPNDRRRDPEGRPKGGHGRAGRAPPARAEANADAEAAPAADPWPDVPPLTDADIPEDDGYREIRLPPPDGYVDGDPDGGDPLDDHFASASPVPAWPPVPPTVPAALPDADGPGGMPDGPAGTPHGRAGTRAQAATRAEAGTRAGGRPRRAAGLLDLTLPWGTLSRAAERPGMLGRIGPITAEQARQLARLGRRDDRTRWRVILTDGERRAIAVATVPRRRPRAGPERLGAPGPPGLTGVVGRVTVVLPVADLGDGQPAGEICGGEIYDEIIAAGRGALAKARERAAADRHAAGGCAHAEATASYRPPPRLREYVVARDQTCRYPSCGQPAWRGDLDHTHPWDKGGLTCRCNMGGLCRRHHRLKQLLGWDLVQPRPGTFRWTTPAGRAYTVEPDLQHC